ncbi:MAG: hypothetical protein ACAH59_00125, partial [Pseudobdellovibrionaceae bacterium]
MKTKLILGMVLVCSFQSAFAGGKSVEVFRKALTDEVARRNQTHAVEKKTTTDKISLTANELSKISGASQVELKAAMQKKNISFKDATGQTKEISILEIGSTISSADQVLRSIDRTTLDADGKARLKILSDDGGKGLQIMADFISLANKTSDAGVATEMSKMEVAVLNQQISLIPDMLNKMDAAEMQSHLAIMDAAVKKRVRPEIPGDQALAAVLKENKTAEEYKQKLNEILNCN